MNAYDGAHWLNHCPESAYSLHGPVLYTVHMIRGYVCLPPQFFPSHCGPYGGPPGNPPEIMAHETPWFGSISVRS